MMWRIETRDTRTGIFRFAGYHTWNPVAWFRRNLPNAFLRGDARAIRSIGGRWQTITAQGECDVTMENFRAAA